MDAVTGPNAAVTFGLLVATVTAAFKYLLDVIKEQKVQLEKSNSALLEQTKVITEIAAEVPMLLKENLEWKERYDALRRDPHA